VCFFKLNYIFYFVLGDISTIPSIRGGAVLTANNEETGITTVATPSIREGALPGAAVNETANNEETGITTVATPSIREGALPGAAVRETVNNEETSKVIMVATPSIREGALPGAAVCETANNEETSKVIMVATPSIREGALPGANHEETTSEVAIYKVTQSLPKLYKVYQSYIKFTKVTQSLPKLCKVYQSTKFTKVQSYYTIHKCEAYLYITLFLVFVLFSLFSGWSFNNLLLMTLLFTAAVYCLFNVCSEDNGMDVFKDFDCNVLERAEQLSVINCNVQIISINTIRSRRERFIYSKEHNVQQGTRVRDREPSRIPVKKINTVLHKSRKIRRLLSSYILKYVPKSSKIHKLINPRKTSAHVLRKDICAMKYQCKMSKYNLFSYQRSLGCGRCIMKLFGNYFAPVALIENHGNGHYKSMACCIPSCSVYKTLNHRKNHCKFTLSGDIESNPGPFTQDNTLAIFQSRLHEQGLQSMDVGGAGDCFFRSVSHQLYGNANNHMTVRTAGVQYLKNNPERFIESVTEHSWQRYLHNMSLQGTWADALIIQAVSDALNITINITESNEGFAPITVITPIHARNDNSTISIGHLDECHYVSTIQFINTHNNLRHNELPINSTSVPINRQSVLLIYSICFSLIKSCPRWDSQTMKAISEHANVFYDNQSLTTVPKVINIYDAAISVQYTTGIHGQWIKTSQQSKEQLKCLILQNTNVKPTGFLLCFLNQYIGCIIQYNKNQDIVKYFLDTINKDDIKLADTSCNIDSFVDTICNIKKDDSNDNEQYTIYILSCSTELTNNAKQGILRKFKSSHQKRCINDQHRKHYSQMEPEKKKRKVETINSTIKEKYKSMDSDEKKNLLESSAKKYKDMDISQKNKLLKKQAKKQAERYNTMDIAHKKTIT